MRLLKFIFLIFIFLQMQLGFSQEIQKKKIEDMTREEIMNMSQDELLDLPLEDLVKLANKLGISIDELLQMKTSVASKTELTPRETPGIVSIITAEEISRSGARDLIDVLRLVPGLNFGYDIEGVVGLAVRGNWAHEGKVLLLVDGQEYNELAYNTLQFGNHFNPDQIKRIEVIRGPGSSVYGGYAELGVINIITKNAEDIKGIELSGTYGQMQYKLGRLNVNMNSGVKIKDWNISALGFIGKANRSDGKYQDFDGSAVDFKNGGAGINTYNLNVGLSHKDFSARLIYDNYQDEYPVDSKDFFKSFFAEIKNEFKINNNLSITPKINFKNSIPYYEDGYYFNTSISRYTETVLLKYNPDIKIDLLGGIESYQDYGKLLENTDSSVFINGSKNINYYNIGAFLQGIVKTRYSNIVIGGRFEYHNAYGSAFAPRIGITKAWNRFHYKLLVSRAFRSPGIMNIEGSITGMVPEKTWVIELELGYKLNDNMFLTANLFNISIKDPIIYYYDNGDFYINGNKTGTRGFEIEYRLRYQWGYLTANYSFNTAKNLNNVPNYLVPQDKNYLMGAPLHKITLNTSFNITNKLYISPSAVYMGKRYAHTDTTGTDNIDITAIKPALLLNIWFGYNDLIIKGLNISCGIFDLLNAKPPFIQSYNDVVPYYPGPSREILFKLSYHFVTR